MSLEAIILLVSGLVAGAVGGWYFSRHQAAVRERERIEALEQALAESHQGMERYRTEVARHFETTASLFTDVSSAYRQLHRHLAEGYETLTGSPSGKLLPEGGDSGPGSRLTRRIPLAVPPIAYASDTPLDETAGSDEDELDEAARRELDALDREEDGLPETLVPAEMELDEVLPEQTLPDLEDAGETPAEKKPDQ